MVTRWPRPGGSGTTFPRDLDKIGIAVGKVISKRKVAKHFILDIGPGQISWRRDQAAIDAEAATDGIYVVRTPVSHDAWMRPPR